MSSNPPFLPVATAAVNWTDAQGQFHLHVYTTDGYTVSERVIGSSAYGWSDGNFSQAASAISATCWVDSGGGHIRVYCTSEDATTEWCCDDADTGTNSWHRGSYTIS